ncbi:hypothetical protein B566_EDAN015739 [Ephemera danica]|nr:hypothetical protein B566_EDAN015739 [Ephemera danica]
MEQHQNFMSQKVALEALQHADDLRRRIGESPEILTSSTEIWTLQQQLQDAYQEVLLMDLELALDQKVEQELWNVAFKKFISALQSLARDKNNTQRNEAKTMLSWFLDAATGYYLGLMQQLCANLHLDLPFLRSVL